MKPIAFYLPQFHCIEENDQWWGKGFTEWTNTKAAKPLFDGHYQPREPYNQNYYNLLDAETRDWQAKLAEKYGIYGFCYYHYWFNGKQLLEKPLERVIESGEPSFPFCIAWANEPWTRAWYANREKEVLIPQEYGTEKDWEEHFAYLLNIFTDKRYIRINNMPILLIYRPESIACCEEMLNYWDSLAKKNGLDGIYYCRMLTGHSSKNVMSRFNAQVEFEPGYTIKVDPPRLWQIQRLLRRAAKKILNIDSKYLLDIVDYDVIWRHIVRRKHLTNTFLGAFVDWDNTARKPHDPTLMSGATPDKFKQYLSKQLNRSKTLFNNEFVFINAWNEWAEGTYLEPDEKNGLSYLEAVRDALQENVR
jgi:lipopolysaccharide biosynthesis protein